MNDFLVNVPFVQVGWRATNYVVITNDSKRELSTQTVKEGAKATRRKKAKKTPDMYPRIYISTSYRNILYFFK